MPISTATIQRLSFLTKMSSCERDFRCRALLGSKFLAREEEDFLVIFSFAILTEDEGNDERSSFDPMESNGGLCSVVAFLATCSKGIRLRLTELL